MFPTFKAGLLATTLAAVALVPAAGIVTLTSVSSAYAKTGGNGNGVERGNGKGSERSGERGNGNGGRGSEARGADREVRGGGRPEWAGSRGNGGGGRSDTARRGQDPLTTFIRGLTGQEKREAREEREQIRAARLAPTRFAPEASIAPGKRPARYSAMHPSDIGNMNGALNANINAVLAHIRNGNSNGPVGSLAALAVADTALAHARTTINEAALAEALGDYPTVQAYYDAGVQDPAIDAALLALGVTPGEPFEFIPPTEDEVLAAEGSLVDLEAARTDAESAILALWNKNGDTDPDVVSPEEGALLDDLRDRLVGYETEIEDAMTEAEVRTASDDDGEDDEASCAGIEGCEGDADEELASAD